MKKIICLMLICSIFIGNPALFSEQIVTVDKFKGLQRDPEAGKIEDGAHPKFDNAYIHNQNVQVVKGRNRLNSTAHTDAVVNMFCYYENAAGTTKKLVVKESDEVVTYDIDGTNRTSIASSLTNEKADCTQDGSVFYFTSSTDGLYKWTGSGSASAVGSVSAPSSVDFSATTGSGGLTTGFNAVCDFVRSYAGTTSFYFRGGTCNSGLVYISGFTGIVAATTVTYKYKITKYSSTFGIESEASSSDDAILTGNSTCTLLTDNCYRRFSNSTCTTDAGSNDCEDGQFSYSGAQTRTTGTLASTPSTPFDVYRIYRTVAGGSDYFLLGQDVGGATYTDGKPDVSLSTPLDTTIDTISPPSFRYIANYKGILFVAENDELRSTRIPVASVSNADTYWLQTDRVFTGIDKPIKGLHSTSNSLIVFAENKIQEWTGVGVTSGRLRTIVEGVGTVSDETIESDDDGNLIFFAGVQGAYKLRIDKSPIDDLLGTGDQSRTDLTRISSPHMDDIFNGDDSEIDLDPADYSNSHAYYDKDNDLYFLFIGEHTFIFDNANNAWSHIPASKQIASVYRQSPNTSGQGVLLDNLGFFYNNWIGYENGIESGTVTGNPTSSTSTTLTCSGCSFNTTNDGLKGIWVYVDHGTSFEYRQITSNTSTVLTVASAWTSNPITTDTFYIAYIVADWKSKQFNVKLPNELEVLAASLIHTKPSSTLNLILSWYINRSSTAMNDTYTIDLSSNYIDKRGLGVRSPWVQLGFKSYLYNTSETIEPPIDIVAYALHAVSWEVE